ncbi:MAG TPA: GAF domain-containing sensor histidine kinase [Chloroflexota bacterium]|nr:GAF domain-containing sensor histidine kinase [Chloroflexota bacterium]
MTTPDPWRIAAALVTAPTLEEQLNLLLREAPRIGGGDSATAYLLDDATGELRVAALYGYAPARDVRPRPSGMTHHVIETGETLVIQDTSADPRINPVVPESGIHALVALPLIARRGGQGAGEEQQPQTTGVLYVNAHRPNAFTPTGIEALTGLAALAAVAIENTLLLEAQRDTAQRLEDALRLREQFVSLASHELKAPLTPLKGYAQAIARRLDRAAATGQPLEEAWLRRALSIMVGQIDRLDRLVTDLLDVSRVRAGRFALQPEPLDLVALATETFERFRDTITTEAATDTPGARHTFSLAKMVQTLPGEWDRTRLDQLLTNLLSNAVKYSPAGGVVELRVGQDESSQALLSVRDEGIGLGGDDAMQGVADPRRSRIFEAFSRGESAEASEATGFGLGLFICAEIARRHGGAIWAESPGPNQGTTFHVRLPLSPPADDASSALGPPAE